MAPIRETAFKKGEPVPESKSNTWRLYSMRFCPFAQRTRLVLAHKNVDYETVNVSLPNKPEWFLEMNPLGMVPVVEKDGTVVYESGICNDYLEELFPERPLYPNDPYQKARVKILMERFGKVVGAFFGAFASANEEKQQEAIKNTAALLVVFEEALQGKFFGGNDLSMLDIHMWPFFERMDALKFGGPDAMANHPKLRAWANNMKEHPTIRATLLSDELHKKYQETFAAQREDVDIGL